MTFIEPSSFPDSPYGYLTNQIGHIALGVVVFCLLPSFAYFSMFDEYPPKQAVFLLAALLYAGFEIWQNGARLVTIDGLFDAVEDFIFTVIYGVSFPLISFTEIQLGDPTLALSPICALLGIAIASAHLFFGIRQRGKRHAQVN